MEEEVKNKEMEEVFGKANPSEEEMVSFILTIKKRYVELANKYQEAMDIIQSKRYDYFVKFLGHKDLFSQEFVRNMVKEIEKTFVFKEESDIKDNIRQMKSK